MIDDYNKITDIIYTLITIPILDHTLCLCFTKKTRWFQLHAATNLIIVYIIWNDIVNLFYSPLLHIKEPNTFIDWYFIIILHLYHFFIVDKLSLMDYIHHTFFIGFGIVPGALFTNCNIPKIGFFASCGLPGFIEYTCLCLVKHQKMPSIIQKRIMAYVYNYIRYPLCLFCISLTYIAYIETNKITDSYLITLYISFLLFLNGAFYNKLTIENRHNHIY